MAITLTAESKKQALASVKRYCAEAFELDIGELKAGSLLDFFLKEIGPSVYNAAIADAQVYLRDRVADLEGTCYEAEFAYWPKASSVRRK